MKHKFKIGDKVIVDSDEFLSIECSSVCPVKGIIISKGFDEVDFIVESESWIDRGWDAKSHRNYISTNLIKYRNKNALQAVLPRMIRLDTMNYIKMRKDKSKVTK